MQGAFINGVSRPKTKKELRETVKADASAVSLEATSMFGDEYDGLLSTAPDGTYYIVGPDPHTSRNWYAQIRVADGSFKVS